MDISFHSVLFYDLNKKSEKSTNGGNSRLVRETDLVLKSRDDLQIWGGFFVKIKALNGVKVVNLGQIVLKPRIFL